MGDELTQTAKDAIAEAVRIVREDKWDKFLRDRVGKHSGTPPVEPPKPKENDLSLPPTNPPTPPNPDPTVPPTDPNPKKKSAYWGDLFEE